MGDFLTRLGVNFLNHKLKITRGGIEVDNGNISGSNASTGSFGTLIIPARGTAAGPTLTANSREGHVGIGVADPPKTLSVGGQVSASGIIYAASGIRTSDGSKSAPAYSFTADDNTGIYRPASDKMTFVVGGNSQLDITSNKISGSATSTGSFGYLNVDGDTVIGGNLTLGDAATDSISFSAEINSNLIPDADSTYDIGSSSKNWRYGYIEQVSSTHVTASGNISASGNVTADNLYGQVATAAQTGITSLFATDIKIGEDNETRIDFGTPNEIHFYAGNQRQIDLEDGIFAPTSDSDVDLGSTGVRWKDAYIDSVTTTGNVSGSTTSTGSFGYLNIDGQAIIKGMGNSNLVNVSSSISTRLSTEETNVDNLQTDSGSFSTRVSNLKTDSGSFSTRISTEESNVDTLQSTMTSEQTNIDNLQTDSGSFSTRVTRNEASASALTTDSGSFSTRVTRNEASASALTTDSGSFSTRITTNTLSGSILAGTGNIQGLGTTNNVQFNHITASGNISSSGTIYADNFQSTGGDSEGISFADDLNITGHITASKNIKSAGDIISTKANGVISGSVSSTGSFGRLETAGNSKFIGHLNIQGQLSASHGLQIDTLNLNNGKLVTGQDDFRIEVQGGSGDVLVKGDLAPQADSTYDAGTNSLAWRKLYVDSIEMNGQGAIAGVTHITASGNISASGTIYADNFQSVGGDSAGISFADDLNITGHITSSKNIKSAGDIISTKANGVISGSVSSTGSFGRIEVGTFSNKSSVVGSSFTGSFSGSFIGQIGARTLHEQSTPATTWSISHGLGTQYVNVTVYDSDDVMVIPTSVTATDASNMSITFSSPVAGTAMLGLGGGTSRNGRTYVHGQSTEAVNWRVTHSLGEQYTAVTVYDEADNVIIPSKINAVGINNAEITFEDATSGNAHFSVGNGIPGITSTNAGQFLRVASNGQNLEFTAANTDVTGALSITGSLTIEGSGHITASGNINSAGDIISTKSNGVISGSVSSTGSFGRLEVAGNSTLTGDITIGGNMTLGDADSDSLSISADLTSNLIPNADSTYDIGSSTKNWRYGYIEQVSATHVTASGNISGSVSSTGSFGAITAAGMSVPNLADVSSSIASRVTTNEGKATKGFTIAMSVAL